MPRWMKFAAAVLLMAVLVLPVLVLFPPRPVLDALAEVHPEVLYFVETQRPAVALTLDDGPHAEVTPHVLDLLAANDARATFFLIGDRIPGNEDLLRRMEAEGHELGNHLSHDEPSLGLPAPNFERQLVSTDALLYGDGAGGGQKWLRPGSGLFNERMIDQAEAHGYRLALGSVYPHDLLLQSPRLIAEYILDRVFRGSILILHDGDGDPDRTLRVLETVLPALRARGFEILTLSELAALQGRRS